MAKKNKEQILEKLKINELNAMQLESYEAIQANPEVIILSPTGTGKTLAFLLPLIEQLDDSIEDIQLLILAPSRELAIQIEQVAREMGTGYKINVVYGGQNFSKDKINLQHKPAILIGTPGRVSDHIRRETFAVDKIKTLVLDEFDKSLEIGFEGEMSDIVSALDNCEKKVLTSATKAESLPRFVGMRSPLIIDRLSEKIEQLSIKKIVSPEKDKLSTLVKALCHLGDKPGIIFCNFKDSIQRVSDFLTEQNIKHGCFYGGLEQNERERALIKFRNGTHKLIIATDLAARGLDIPEIKFIIHYHLPSREEEFTHRNGRTARMNADGTAYVLIWEEEPPKEYMPELEEEKITDSFLPPTPQWATLFVSGGRKDKISKGDIAGLFMKQGGFTHEELGIIEIKTDCAFVAIKKNKAEKAIQELNNSRLKKKKVRIYKI